jgi:hypothetical protein
MTEQPECTARKVTGSRDEWLRRQAAKFPKRIGPKSAERLARLLDPNRET